MIQRFRRLHGEFGTTITVRTVLLLVGLAGMGILGALVRGRELPPFWAW
jgi:hypothetical protein